MNSIQNSAEESVLDEFVYLSASVFLRTTTKRFLPNTAELADPDNAVFRLIPIRSCRCLTHLGHFESYFFSYNNLALTRKA
jgi:hypothetical protein